MVVEIDVVTTKSVRGLEFLMDPAKPSCDISSNILNRESAQLRAAFIHDSTLSIHLSKDLHRTA